MRSRNPAGKLTDDLDNLTLPSASYKKNRHSAMSQPSDASMNGEEVFISMALDPNPAPGPSPLTMTPVFELAGDDLIEPPSVESKPPSHDYFTAKDSDTTSRVTSQDYEHQRTSVTSYSPRESHHSSLPGSPQISHPAGHRDTSSDVPEVVPHRREPNPGNAANSDMAREGSRDLPNDVRPPRSGHHGEDEHFLLQEVPKSKKAHGPSRSSKSGGISQTVDTSAMVEKSNSAPASANYQINEQHIIFHSNELPVSRESNSPINGSPAATSQLNELDQERTASPSRPSSQPSSSSVHLDTLPRRSDSLARSGAANNMAREVVDTGYVGSLLTVQPNPETHNSKSHPTTSLGPAWQSEPASEIPNGTAEVSALVEGPLSASIPEIPHPPARARERDRLGHMDGTVSDSFGVHRSSPGVLPGTPKAKHESTSTQRSDSSRNGDVPPSPKLPRYSTGGGFSMDDDMARILGSDDQQDQASFLRRVSNSVRHARSYSDRGTRLSREQKWPRSPLAGSPSTASVHENGSPTSSAVELRDELSCLKNELARERQKTAAKEQRLSELEQALQARNNIRQMNSELREKRSTMVVLDTQKEIVVRELEVLTEHIAAAKKSGEPLDIGRMSNMVLREFAEALQALKESFAPQIEDLTQRRNDLIEEVSSLTQSRDKSFQEFEQLSSKNAQLADLNNQLVHQIQELRKLHASPSIDMVPAPANGLGIYTPNAKEKYTTSLDGRDLRTSSTRDSNLSGSTVMPEHEGDSCAHLTTPQVVKIRKAQPKKFNWKRGGHTVAKGVSKGLKGAFTSNDPSKVSRDGQFAEGSPYGAILPGQEPLNGHVPRGQMHDPTRQGFGFFGNPKGRPAQLKSMANGGIPPVNSDGVPGM